MADKLTELYDQWLAKVPDGNHFQAFQAGLTAGAVSMRTRALAACDDVPTNGGAQADVKNEIKNEIGSLPDIPTE